MGSKGQNSTFSEHGHVAYQIKGNQVCSNMVANILIVDLLPPLPQPQNCISNYREKGMQRHGSKYFCPQPPPPHPLTLYIKHIKHDFRSKAWVRPLGGLRGLGQKVKIQLVHNMDMLHIKLKGIRNAATW